MVAPSTPTRARTGLRRVIILGLVGILLLAGCGSAGSGGSGSNAGARLLHYQRVWPDGTIEQQTIFADGRVEMKHGEVLERLTITAADVARIQAALQTEIPLGSPGDSPQRTLTLADGTVLEAPRPDPGTVTALLEQLLTTHRLT
jgi:hypothetical protein